MKTRLLPTILLAVLLAVASQPGRTQDLAGAGVKDYAAYPYWSQMMLDPQANFFEVQKAFYAYWEGRTPTRGSGYKPFKRWEWYWQSRINPDGFFPSPDKVYREYQNYVEAHPVADNLKSGNLEWAELGPKTRLDYGGYVGVGRINAIAFHPTDSQTLYIGAPSGGFWITHDGGVSWTTHTDNMPTLGVSAILVDPDQPDVILIGTGDRDGGNAPGMGVFRSTDGGVIFAPYNAGMGNYTIGMFARDDNKKNHILAAGGGAMFNTTDGGENWVKATTDDANYRDVKFRPGSSTIAYATADGNFYRTEDGGQSWVKLPSANGYPTGGRLVIGTTPANDSLVYLVAGASEFQGCFLSRDFGQTFVSRSTTPNILGWSYEGDDEGSQAWYDLIIHVDPVDPNLVHAGGVNLWKSVDGGVTWTITGHWWGDRTNEVHADEHTFAFNPLNNRIYAGNDGGIYWTEDQGTAWTEVSEGLGIGQMYRLGVSANMRYKVCTGFQDNGAATWTTITGAPDPVWLNSGGGDGMECAVDPFDAKWSYTSVYYGSLTRFTNNASGRTVAGKGTNGITEEGAWVTPFLLSEWDGNTMVVGYKNIWISRNIRNLGTITFTKISDNLAGSNTQNMAVLEQSPVNPSLLFAVRGDSKLFRTENLLQGAVSWTNITSSLPVNGTPSDIECYPYDENIVFLALNNRIYKSFNKGGRWTNISGTLPDININSIVCDKTSEEGVYIGTDAGVYYRDAEMEDWVLHGTGLPVSVEVTEVEIYYDRGLRADSRLRASTYGRGLWEVPLAPASTIMPPSMLTATEVDNEAIELAWVTPFYVQTVLGYQIYRNGEKLLFMNGNSYTDSEIQPDITYTYTVTAVYAGNIESRHSNEASATIVSEIVLPYTQTFENGTGGWKAKFTQEGWQHGTADQVGVPGREGKFFAASSVAAGQGVVIKDYLTTPGINLSSYTGRTITLRFAFTMRKYRTYDKFSVQYRPAPDSAWVKLVDLKPPHISSWVWDTTEINLPEKALTATMQIAFYYDNSNEFAYGAAVDDVQLFLNTTSAKPLDQLSVITVFPNPGSGLFHLNMQVAKPGPVTVTVYGLNGQIILKKVLDYSAGILVEPIDLSKESRGIYQLVVQTPSGEWKEKITLQ